MIKKYKKQIGLGIFTTILFIMFFILIIKDSNFIHLNMEETSSNSITTTQPQTTTVIGTETTVSLDNQEETTKKISIKKIKKKHKNKLPFKIKVNRVENFVTVYTLDEKGKYTVPYKTFLCSTGATIDSTPLGTFEITERYDWRIMVDGTYAQYAIRIHGPIMLHSIPYTTNRHDALEYWEYNKLGKPASLGCVRLRAGDVKWIYDNCENGTKVKIYDKPNEKPAIKIPKLKKLKKKNKNKGWDPSDPDKNNPWLKRNK